MMFYLNYLIELPKSTMNRIQNFNVQEWDQILSKYALLINTSEIYINNLMQFLKINIAT